MPDLYAPQPIRLELIRRLAKAAPPSHPREVRDRSAKLILRHQPSGHLSLYVHLGRGKRERLCDARRVIDPDTTLTLGMVKQRAVELLGEHVGGRDFAAEREARRALPTLKEFLEKTYGPWVKLNRKSGAGTLGRLESCFLNDIGSVRLDDVTPAKLEPWRRRRQHEGTKPETINRDIVALRASLSRAVKLEILKHNPLSLVERAKVDRHKQDVRALSTEEKVQLVEALRARDGKKREQRASANGWRTERGYALKPTIGEFADALTPAVIVSLETGLRRGELFALEWPMVDLREKTLRVAGAGAKTYETRDVPLNTLALDTLQAWWVQCGEPNAGPVFAIGDVRISNLKRSYHAALASAGIERKNVKGERVNWHSLRHTFGTLLGAKNVDATTLMKLMGHANLETTQRYLHTDKNRKRAAVELLQKQSILDSK
jgi:integrase